MDERCFVVPQDTNGRVCIVFYFILSNIILRVCNNGGNYQVDKCANCDFNRTNLFLSTSFIRRQENLCS